MYSPDHPAGIVGLSNILLDIYDEKLRPLPTVPTLGSTDGAAKPHSSSNKATIPSLPSGPLGLGPLAGGSPTRTSSQESLEPHALPEPYKAECLPLVDRLAARDRASTLLSGLTRLGTGWNYSEAWFALARAHEDSGQPDKAKEVLWWCVELEEARGVRDWRSLGAGGYVL